MKNNKIHSDINKVFALANSVARMGKIILWFFKWGIIVSEILSVIAICGWISLLIFYIWTEDAIYTKYFFTILIIASMLIVIVSSLDKLFNRKPVIKTTDKVSKKFKVIRHIMFFAVEDEISYEKLKEFYSDKSINDFVKYGYLQLININNEK